MTTKTTVQIEEVFLDPEFEPARQAFARFIDESTWTFAKTYAKKSPHEYAVKAKLPPHLSAQWDSHVSFIRKYGVKKRYARTDYTHFDIDGRSYWTMGEPVEITAIMNRHDLSFYDRVADNYDESFSDPGSQAENEAVFQLVAPALAKAESVLDIGSGTGLFLDLAAEHNLNGFRYVGIDPSHKMTEHLQEKHPDQAVALQTFEQFADEYSGHEPKFDLVAGLFASVSYVDQRYLHRIKNFLAPEGKFFLMFYRPGYIPVTYEKNGFMFSHFSTRRIELEAMFGTTRQLNNFIIATNISGEPR